VSWSTGCSQSVWVDAERQGQADVLTYGRERDDSSEEREREITRALGRREVKQVGGSSGAHGIGNCTCMKTEE
jgi:hypothetical protein